VKRHARLIAVLTLVLIPCAALAAEAPKVPVSAKKLTSAEILKLYDNQTFAYEAYMKDGVGTGTATYDFTAKKNKVNWTMGNKSGTAQGSIRIKSNQFCYTIGGAKESCNFLYVDGSDVYEVNSKGVVTAKTHKQ
jgi:hypothetical protein